MANINIGGRLHSTATGNTVAGANEILDDSKGKKQSVINQETDAALAGKQATIEDLSTIRSGAAAGATAYQKPGTGIPSTDMASGVQTSLGKADTAYQKPGAGVPKTDLESGVQASLDLADSAIQARPMGAIDPTITPADYATKEELDELEAELNGAEPIYNSLDELFLYRNSSGYWKSSSGQTFSIKIVPISIGDVINVTWDSTDNKRWIVQEYPVANAFINNELSQITPEALTESFTATVNGYFVFYNRINSTTPFIIPALSLNNVNLLARTVGLVEKVEDLSDNVDALDERIDDLEENETITITTSATPIVGVAFSAVIGQAPQAVSNSDYKSIKIDGLRNGDTVTAHARAGSSYSTLIKTNGGLVTTYSATGVEINQTIECDGTFDGIILNSYNLRVDPPTATIVQERTIKEYFLSIIPGKKTLKLLCFGNSFTQDTFGYVPQIMKAVAPELDFTLGIAYQGGSPVAEHCAFITGEDITFDGVSYTTVDGAYYKNGNAEPYSYYKSVGGNPFVVSSGKTVSQMLDDEDWDIITFQQGGLYADSEYSTAYEPYITKAQKAICTSIGRPISFGWVMVHGAYNSTAAGREEKWEGSALNAQKVMQKTGTSILFPYGTAVQNLRTTSAGLLGDYNKGGALQVDNAHLQAGIGALCAAYANTITLLKYAAEKAGIMAEQTRPTDTWLALNNIPTHLGTGVIGITDNYVYLAQVAAEKAVLYPFTLSDISSLENM